MSRYPDEAVVFEVFASLWDSINGDRAAWSTNPWVWVVSFRRIDSDGGAS